MSETGTTGGAEGGAQQSFAAEITQQSADAVTTAESTAQQTEQAQQTPQETLENKDQVEAPKKYTLKGLKIRGEEKSLEDIDEDSLKKIVQKGLAADQSWQEAAQIRKDADAKFQEYQQWKNQQDDVQKRIKQNPLQYALENGADPALVRDATEKWLLEQIQQDELSPEAKRALHLEKELETVKKQQQTESEKIKEAQLAQRAEVYRQEYQKAIMEASDSQGLPKTANNIRRIADHMKIAQQRGFKPDANRAASLVHEENVATMQSMVGGYAKSINEAFKGKDSKAVLAMGQQLEGLLGSDVFTALQRYGISKYRAKSPNVPAPVLDTAKSVNPEQEQAEIDRDELLEERRQKAEQLQKQWDLRNRSAAPAP